MMYFLPAIVEHYSAKGARAIAQCEVLGLNRHPGFKAHPPRVAIKKWRGMRRIGKR